MNAEAGLTKNQIIQELTRSPHGKLEEYAPVAHEAALSDPRFFAQLIAWNFDKGAIRDSKVALPAYSLASWTRNSVASQWRPDSTEEENSFAHLAMLDPRNFVRALNLLAAIKPVARRRQLKELVRAYLRHRERSFGLWERAVIQHRASMKTLYARWHIKPGSDLFDQSLFKNTPPKGSTLDIIRQLKDMAPQEALGQVLNRKIPFLVAVGALGTKIHDSDVVLALINSMSPTELTTNAKMLERLGIKTNPALRAAFATGLQKAVEQAPAAAILKTGTAAAAVGGETGKVLAAAQEKQITASGGLKGRWAVFADKSGSMEQGIEAARFIASHIARFAESAHMIFYDVRPYGLEVTGQTLEWVKEKSAHMQAGGGTVAGICVEVLRLNKILVDGVAVITDCEDNQPHIFVELWQKYCREMDHSPTLYIFRVGKGQDTLLPAVEAAGILNECFDLRGGVDYYSLPNLISTMSSKRWSVLDDIMATPLKTRAEIFAE